MPDSRRLEQKYGLVASDATHRYHVALAKREILVPNFRKHSGSQAPGAERSLDSGGLSGDLYRLGRRARRACAMPRWGRLLNFGEG